MTTAQLGAQKGNHRGVLAGLPEEYRRELAIRETLSLLGIDDDRKERELEELAETGEPVCTLAGMLDAITREQLCGIARDYELKGYSKLKKAELVRLIADTMAADGGDLFMGASCCEGRCYEALRRAAGEGGSFTLRDDEVREAPLLAPLPPYVCLYRVDEGFMFLIPEEMRPLVAALDWDKVDEARKTRDDVIALCEWLAERCGVVSLADALERYNAWFGATLSEYEFGTHALGAIEELEPMYGFWECEDVPYLVAPDLDPAQISPDDEEGAKYCENFRRFLLNKHAERPVGPFPEAMRETGSYEALSSMPSARALRAFFDAHVPDDDNDYTYADRMLENIYDLNGNLVDFEQTARSLAQADLCLDEDEQAEMLPLLRAFLEDIPYWENNGWSNNQLREATGAKAFYGADGSSLKVGRNDPCPCGSGKKYKKCCGA